MYNTIFDTIAINLLFCSEQRKMQKNVVDNMNMMRTSEFSSVHLLSSVQFIY